MPNYNFAEEERTVEMKRGYKGYKAYQFLTPGKGYTVFELTPEYNAIAGQNEYLPLTPEQEAFEKKIIANHPLISLHEHPFLCPADMNQRCGMLCCCKGGDHHGKETGQRGREYP